jgi:putative transposase
MPWKETDVVEQRMKFISDWLSDDFNMSELCAAYGISRETGYVWKRRYEAEGVDGLSDRSSAPHNHPNATSSGRVQDILQLRKKHPTWGPKKLKPRLERLYPRRNWPSKTTIGTILHRHDLSKPRRRRAQYAPPSGDLACCDKANAVWGIDYKGWFRTGNGQRCNPLSLSDLSSRYLLRLQCVERYDTKQAWSVLDSAFREFGLPERIRSDNGTPFASLAVGGISELSIRIIKAGVVPERISLGKPQQNGRHERVHLTIAQDTAEPPAKTIRDQQKRFEEFCRVFNHERPHEALNFSTPSNHYTQSLRRYTGKLREPEYPCHHEVRRVRYRGTIRWQGELIYLSDVLHREPVGIEQISEVLWSVRYGPIILGYIDTDNKFHRLKSGVHPRLETMASSR